MVTEPQWKGCFFSVLTSLSAWQSSGISSSWNSGRLLCDYKRMNGFKEEKRSCAKSPTKTCKHGKSEDTQRITCCHGLPFKLDTGNQRLDRPKGAGVVFPIWCSRNDEPEPHHPRCISCIFYKSSAETLPNQHGSTPSVAPRPPRIKYFFIAAPAEHRAV